MRPFRLAVPGLLALIVAGGVRMGMDQLVETIADEPAAVAAPYHPANVTNPAADRLVLARSR